MNSGTIGTLSAGSEFLAMSIRSLRKPIDKISILGQCNMRRNRCTFYTPSDGFRTITPNMIISHYRNKSLIYTDNGDGAVIIGNNTIIPTEIDMENMHA